MLTADRLPHRNMHIACDTISMAYFPGWPIKEQHNEGNL